MSNAEDGQSTGDRLKNAARRGFSAAKRRHGIERLGPLEDVTVALPVSGTEYQITKPTDVDMLLDLAMHDPEENLPYWAALWPSGVALADAVVVEPDLVRGKRVLELGTGLGVTSIAALSVGADLTITDYAGESLQLAIYNAVENGQAEPPALRMNWRAPSDEFRALTGDGFPVVLAADVLYEQRDIEPLLDLVEWLVAPDGLFWLAEPRRSSASQFIERAGERGWQDEVAEFHGPWSEKNDTGVVVRVHKLRRHH